MNQKIRPLNVSKISFNYICTSIVSKTSRNFWSSAVPSCQHITIHFCFADWLTNKPHYYLAVQYNERKNHLQYHECKDKPSFSHILSNICSQILPRDLFWQFDCSWITSCQLRATTSSYCLFPASFGSSSSWLEINCRGQNKWRHSVILKKVWANIFRQMSWTRLREFYMDVQMSE